jgi:hypothetical protein
MEPKTHSGAPGIDSVFLVFYGEGAAGVRRLTIFSRLFSVQFTSGVKFNCWPMRLDRDLAPLTESRSYGRVGAK